MKQDDEITFDECGNKIVKVRMNAMDALHRPSMGPNNAEAEARVSRANAEADDRLQNAWQHPSQSIPRTVPAKTGDPYRDYDDYVSNAWRQGKR